MLALFSWWRLSFTRLLNESAGIGSVTRFVGFFIFSSFFSPLLSVAMVSAMLFSWFFCRIYDLTSIVAVPLLFHVYSPISIFCVYFRGFFKVIFFVVDFPWLNLSQFDFLYFLLSAGMFFQYFYLFCSCFLQFCLVLCPALGEMFTRWRQCSNVCL